MKARESGESEEKRKKRNREKQEEEGSKDRSGSWRSQSSLSCPNPNQGWLCLSHVCTRTLLSWRAPLDSLDLHPPDCQSDQNRASLRLCPWNNGIHEKSCVECETPQVERRRGSAVRLLSQHSVAGCGNNLQQVPQRRHIYAHPNKHSDD